LCFIASLLISYVAAKGEPSLKTTFSLRVR
jgi:hypothetical protein